MTDGVIFDPVDEQAYDARTSANLAIARAYLYTGPDVGYEIEGALVGAWTSLDDTPVVGSGTGVLSHDFTDDWYYRIHVIPRAIDFGNLQSTQVEQFIVWNSFFDARELTSVAFVPPPGLSLTFPDGVEPLPYSLGPLELITFDVTGTTTGPPTITGEITLLVDGSEYDISITGRRIILFPFPPNWASPFDEIYEFNSWVLRNADLTEQTGSIWGNTPRRRFDYTVTTHGTRAQMLENIIFGWMTRFYGVIHWAEGSKLITDVLAGNFTLPLDTTKMSLQDGGTVVLYADVDTHESREIASFTDTTITLTTALLRDWATGTRVYPSFVAVLNPSSSGSHVTDNVISMPVSFECEPSTTETNTADDGLALTYRGEELYMGRVNWKAGINFNYESPGKKIDFGSGKFRLFSHEDNAVYSRAHDWLIKNKSDAAALRAWLGRREGMARPVYMPSGNIDFTLVAPIVSPSDSLDVTENEHGSLVALNPSRRDVLVLLRDGTYYARRITNVAQVSDTVSRIFLDTAIVADIDPSQIKRISYLGYYRQAGDSTTIRWLTDEVAVCQMQLQTKATP